MLLAGWDAEVAIPTSLAWCHYATVLSLETNILGCEQLVYYIFLMMLEILFIIIVLVLFFL